MTGTGRQRIATWQVGLYALPNIPHSLALLPVVNFVPAFYSDDLGLPLAMVGLMLFLSRIGDIFVDPVIGVWSDRLRTRFGRRRPFILAGLPVICVSVWLCFVPGPQPGLVYLLACLFFVYLGFTMIDLPYQSWGSEMSGNYDERSRISAWRGAFGSVGTLLALTIPLILEATGQHGARPALFWMAVFFIILQPLAFMVMMAKLPEPPPGDVREGPQLSLRAGVRLVLQNTVFVRLNIALALILVGLVVGASLNLLVVTYVIGAPGAFPTIIFLQNVMALLGIPVWTRVAARYGKHVAMLACALWIAACMASSFIWTRGDAVGFGASIVVLGFGMGGLLFLYQAMIADITDQDLLESGEERTATFFAVLGMTSKAAIAVGVLIGTGLSALVGFQPSDAVHSAASLLGLKAVYAFTCVPLIAIAAWLLWRYPLTRAVQERVRADIVALRAAATHNG
jgi:GPH family glycoside/pentoside/hexuronide:cation symporter